MLAFCGSPSTLREERAVCHRDGPFQECLQALDETADPWMDGWNTLYSRSSALRAGLLGFRSARPLTTIPWRVDLRFESNGNWPGPRWDRLGCRSCPCGPRCPGHGHRYAQSAGPSCRKVRRMRAWLGRPPQVRSQGWQHPVSALRRRGRGPWGGGPHSGWDASLGKPCSRAGPSSGCSSVDAGKEQLKLGGGDEEHGTAGYRTDNC